MCFPYLSFVASFHVCDHPVYNTLRSVSHTFDQSDALVLCDVRDEAEEAI
jgi:hypothetical protein